MIALQLADLAAVLGVGGLVLVLIRRRPSPVRAPRRRSHAAAVIRLRAGGCVYCGRPAGCIDHVRPVSRGGSDDESNRVGCCLACNASKRDKLITEWIPARVLRAVAVEPKVYAELLRIRSEATDHERRTSERVAAIAEASEDGRSETLRSGRLVGLREAIDLGIIPVRQGATAARALEAVRKARQWDSTFPAPAEGGEVGREALYRPGELAAWARNRPRAGVS